MKDVLRMDERGLEEWLSEPLAATRATLKQIEGDVAVLGAGGKMGPTLAMMLKKAAPGKTVYAVSRFSDKQARQRIEEKGVKIVEADLLDESAYGQPAGCAQRLLPGGHEVRRRRQSAADVGDERLYARARGPAVQAGADRRSLDRQRVSVHPCRRAGDRARRTCPIPSASTPNRASAASGCSSISPSGSARP